MLIEPFSENYLKKLIKKLIGNNEIDDALKRLDRLTQEEARMASVQLLKITNAIDSEVGEVAGHLLIVDDRVAGVDEHVTGVDKRVARVDERLAGVDERMACIDECMAGVDNRVAGISDQVQGIDDKVTTVIGGTQYIFHIIVQLSDP